MESRIDELNDELRRKGYEVSMVKVTDGYYKVDNEP